MTEKEFIEKALKTVNEKLYRSINGSLKIASSSIESIYRANQLVFGFEGKTTFALNEISDIFESEYRDNVINLTGFFVDRVNEIIKKSILPN